MTWMTTIVRNKCFDLLRAMPQEAQLLDEASLDDWASDDLGPLQQVTEKVNRKRC